MPLSRIAQADESASPRFRARVRNAHQNRIPRGLANKATTSRRNANNESNNIKNLLQSRCSNKKRLKELYTNMTLRTPPTVKRDEHVSLKSPSAVSSPTPSGQHCKPDMVQMVTRKGDTPGDVLLGGITLHHIA